MTAADVHRALPDPGYAVRGWVGEAEMAALMGEGSGTATADSDQAECASAAPETPTRLPRPT